MIFGEVFNRFINESPVTVMFRALMEKVFSEEAINTIFQETARRQKAGELVFSAVVDLLALVVCGARKSVNAAYTAAKERVAVSVKSVYNKLDGVEPVVSRELVRQTARELKAIVRQLRVPFPTRFPGYCVKILDGNHFPATEHRLAELRTIGSGPLPGQALCVLEPGCMLMTDVFPCEDGHAQERRLLGQVLETVERGDLWIADRNFCVTWFLFAIADRLAYFIIRQHASTLKYELLGKRKPVGRCKTGMVYEQRMRVYHPDGSTRRMRRVTIVLDQPTENGDGEIHLVTNLPRKVSALLVADGYRGRWKVENAFHEIEQSLESEIRTLAYPKAALLAFCLALVLYNLLSTVKAAIAAVHGDVLPRERISGYYLAEEISASYRGMLIAIPAATWTRRFAPLSAKAMARVLRDLAAYVRPDQFRKSQRGPKKPRPKRSSGRRNHHVSTARIIARREPKANVPC
jgi:hypothetical protein